MAKLCVLDKISPKTTDFFYTDMSAISVTLRNSVRPGPNYLIFWYVQVQILPVLRSWLVVHIFEASVLRLVFFICNKYQVRAQTTLSFGTENKFHSKEMKWMCVHIVGHILNGYNVQWNVWTQNLNEFWIFNITLFFFRFHFDGSRMEDWRKMYKL